jgi:hypothetical protein
VQSSAVLKQTAKVNHKIASPGGYNEINGRYPAVRSRAAEASPPHGTMGADSSDTLLEGVDACGGVKNADLPTKLIRLASASFS